MTKDSTVFLEHILESIESIKEYARDISEEDFLKSQEKQDAIIRRLEIIGEAVGNLSDDFKNQYPDIAWNKAMSIRNILIHNYFGVDLKIVWDTITKSLPEFKKQIKEILKTSSEKTTGVGGIKFP